MNRKIVAYYRCVLSLETFVHTDAKGRKVEKQPKRGRKKAEGKNGRRSVRKVPLLPTLVQAFRFYLAGRQVSEDGYIFADENNGLLNDTNWRRHHFRPLVKKLGLEGATPYDLRHSANTFLAENGVPTEVRAAICGHSKEVNLRVYTHFGLKAKREALANLDALFAGAFAQPEDANKGKHEGKGEAEVAA